MTKHLILVVENDPSMQTLYNAIFRRYENEFTFSLVHTGEAALKFLEQKAVHLLVLAWDLPGMPGIDVLQLVRATEATKSLPVVVVSPTEDPEERFEALNHGADHYQSKAFNVSELVARIRGLLQRRPGRRGWPKLLTFLLS